MRLLDARTFQFKEVSDPRKITKYAVLSHTWADNEVVYSDLVSSLQNVHQRPEFAKIKFTAQQALADGFDYIWIDTTCIDKSSSADLSESINSMFKIYKNAQVCYIYLTDVMEPPPEGWTDDGADDNDWTKAFVNARWFTRGWTLQELIAPRNCVFYTSDWRRIGTKRGMCHTLARHTGISSPILLGADFSRTLVAERMNWASKRTTTREEDLAYCLLGLFDINLPLLYGEGERAFLRLQHEIIKKTNDRSIFLWSALEESHTTFRSLFARSPAEFASFSDYTLFTNYGRFEVTQKGLEIDLHLVQVPSDDREFYAVLVDAGEGFHCARLRQISPTEYARVDADEIFRILNPHYVRFATRQVRPETKWITVPNTFDGYDRDAYMDFRLGGFQVEYHPIELQIQSVEPRDAWNEETQTLMLDLSQNLKPFEEGRLNIVFREVSHPDKTYKLDLIDKMRTPTSLSTWGPSPANEKLGYIVRMKQHFVGDKMINVVKIDYQIFLDNGWQISPDKNPLPGRYTWYRTITDEEHAEFAAVLDRERKDENRWSESRVIEEVPPSPMVSAAQKASPTATVVEEEALSSVDGDVETAQSLG
ncbi:HET-domain-containing protein [Lentithecium fluviatile CBS 122367]|uniref:HET-domain-containing protein n=1 Tax=Lentithecium fluviatile CBS 122367 TaxID=1168545 RepID=A0A6G1IZB8_9PLEO|nr:HET-domain-containing protein [Lentithecium fluviatile CBS 122367]